MKGSSWGERCAQAPSEEAQKNFTRSFLERCGANPKSKDVHWPMTLSLRVPVATAEGTQLRASGFRQRSATATAARRAKKRARGYLPYSGQWNTAAPAAAETVHGRSSGSAWEADPGRSSGSGASGSGSWAGGAWAGGAWHGGAGAGGGWWSEGGHQ